MTNAKRADAGFDIKAPILRKPVRQFFEIFLQTTVESVQRKGPWMRMQAKNYFLSFSNQLKGQSNPTKLPYRGQRETLDGVFGMFTWD